MEKLDTTRRKYKNAVAKLLEKLDGFRKSTNFDREDAFTTLKLLTMIQENLHIIDEQIVYELEIEKIEEDIITASEYSFDVALQVSRFQTFFKFSETVFGEDITPSRLDLDVFLNELDSTPDNIDQRTEPKNSDSMPTQTFSSMKKRQTVRKIICYLGKPKKHRRTKLQSLLMKTSRTVRIYRKDSIKSARKLNRKINDISTRKRTILPRYWIQVQQDFKRSYDSFLFLVISIRFQRWKRDG